jgi:hypothetical protein
MRTVNNVVDAYHQPCLYASVALKNDFTFNDLPCLDN